MEQKRENEILAQAEMDTEFVNPIKACTTINDVLDENSIIIADGGDFVGTASYVLRPRAPLSWLDPGAFGTLGVLMLFSISIVPTYYPPFMYVVMSVFAYVALPKSQQS